MSVDEFKLVVVGDAGWLWDPAAVLGARLAADPGIRLAAGRPVSRPGATSRLQHAPLRRARASVCNQPRRKMETCHAAPTFRETCGMRPFSRAIRSIASAGRTAARTGFRSRRRKRFIPRMTSLTMRVSRGWTRQYRRSARAAASPASCSQSG